MRLHFPNASRNYDSSRRCVCFWGHDSAIEVSLHLDEEALMNISPYASRDEDSLLRIFDVNRARIEEAAAEVYSRLRERQTYLRLSASDLAPRSRWRKSWAEAKGQAASPKSRKS